MSNSIIYGMIILQMLAMIIVSFLYGKVSIKKILHNRVLMIRNMGKISLYLSFLVLIVILRDIWGVQGDGEGWGFGILFLPIIFVSVSFIFYTFFILYIHLYFFLFHYVEWCFNKFCNKQVNVIVTFAFLTILSIIFFQWLWWTYFYTEVSLPRRVIGWNIITIVFPIISLIGAILMDIEVVDE